MDARELASRAWRGLADRHGCSGAAAGAVLDVLVRAYGEVHRHYHTLDHVAALLRLLDEHGAEVADRDALALAILFHDAVYDPARHDNEQASATFASKRLAGLGYPEVLVAKVVRYIIATQHGQGNAPPNDDADLALLLDLDLSILAATPTEYRAYAQAIRGEYATVPAELYRSGRRRVLKRFLARERIYHTGKLRSLWEARARANLAREIAELA
jgi:predicted metal-dependent HD superfamily phosphohydrolase